jgi:hypothetical protein
MNAACHDNILVCHFGHACHPIKQKIQTELRVYFTTECFNSSIIIIIIIIIIVFAITFTQVFRIYATCNFISRVKYVSVPDDVTGNFINIILPAALLP